MYPVISILSGLLFGGLCSNLAGKKGRGSLFWFSLGFFFGVFSLIALYFLPAKEMEADEPTLVKPPTSEEKPLPTMTEKLWYYLDQAHRRHGPMSFERLQKSWREGYAQARTLVWNEELNEWKKIEDLSDIHELITKTP